MLKSQDIVKELGQDQVSEEGRLGNQSCRHFNDESADLGIVDRDSSI